MKSKRLIAAVLSMLIAVPALAPASKAEAAGGIAYIPLNVANGGFEEPMQGSTIPSWTTNPDSTTFDATLSAAAVTDIAYAGNKSLKMIDHDTVRSLEVQSSLIPITEEETYRVRTQVFVEAKSVRVYVRFKATENGADLTNGSFNYLANTTGSWNKVEFEAYAPKGAQYAQVTFYYGASGTGTIAYLDEVQLEHKKMPTSTIELPYASTAINLGEPVKIGLSHASVYGIGPDGKQEQYITTTGSPIGFSVNDPYTGTMKFSQQVAGATDPVWGMTMGSDGNVYFASTGKLFRYLVKEQRIENLGTNPTGNTTMYDLKASSDGKIYGSTFHSSNLGKVFEYDIETNEFIDLGVVKAGEAYARGLGVTDKYVYVGTGNKAGLVRIDRNTNEKTEIEIPGYTGESGKMFSDIEIYNGYLFVYGAQQKLHILKEDTLEYINTIPFQSKISPPDPNNPDQIYYKNGTEFFSYNMTDATATKIEGILLPSEDIKGRAWLKADSGRFKDKMVLFISFAFGEAMMYEPLSGEHEMLYINNMVVGTPVNVMEYNDGKLYMSGFQRGMSILDTATDTLIYNNPSFHQAESIGFNQHAAYFGTYTGAKMYRMDLSQPIEYNANGWGNPGLVADIDYNQNRPFSFTTGGGKLFTGTFPASGFEGALTMMEEVRNDNGEVTGVTHETLPNLMPNQSIIGLAYKDGKVYGSTTVYSSSGSLNPAPLKSEAEVFIFNPETKVIEKSVTPKVLGVTNEVKIIGELSVGPDGLIWGIQDAFIGNPGGYDASIFALDPVTLEVVKAKKITVSPVSTSKYRPYFIRWGNDGLIYSTIGRKVYAINPDTLDAKEVLPGKTINMMTLADNGDLYYIEGTKLFKLPVKLVASAPVANKDSLQVGGRATLSTTLSMANQSQRDFSNAVITYVSDNPSIVEVEGNKIKAVGVGTANITATVTFADQTVVTEPLPFNVHSPQSHCYYVSDGKCKK